MYIDNIKSLYNTKMIAYKGSGSAVQRKLQTLGITYQINLEKSFHKHNLRGKECAFFIDNAGVLEIIIKENNEDDDFYIEFDQQPEEEINSDILL